MKKTILIPLYSLFLSLSAFTLSASAMTLKNAREVSPDLSVDDILNPIIEFFKALLNFILAPFKAIGDVFNSWAQNLYSSVGVWAPVVAVVIVGISLFIIYLFLRFKRMIPTGE